MNLIPEIVTQSAELTDWRRHIHAHPELAFEETQTAAFVAEKLRSFGIDVVEGIAGTGVVGTLQRGGGNRSIGLRADLDALPIVEANDFEHRSTQPGVMHACGHDGHTTMLLGAAAYLAASDTFSGTVHFIFQPAEENEGGARAMVEAGLFEQFPMEAVYGMHNIPGIPVGEFAVKPGPMMAAFDIFDITVRGRGGHAAIPQQTVDPVLIGTKIVEALQTLVAREINPQEPAVLSVTQFHGGDAYNVIPDQVSISGCTRCFSTRVQAQFEQSIERVACGIASGFGAEIEFSYERRYPPTVNSPTETESAAEAAIAVSGATAVNRAPKPSMGSEDFAYMLQEKPGCYIWIGNGDGEGSCMIHNPGYDFNDEILPIGASYWSALVAQLLPKRD
ncbi:MAG: peptidase M20 [Gammaproteobacteria bacterium TMED95]|nr:peptidase M20 [Gammaproteobacteria bacterium]OUV20188.1 MAG: peptidase M20 [Gammaproteobacteria bacterium TMED95]